MLIENADNFVGEDGNSPLESCCTRAIDDGRIEYE